MADNPQLRHVPYSMMDPGIIQRVYLDSEGVGLSVRAGNGEDNNYKLLGLY